jgi:hypothetical protein
MNEESAVNEAPVELTAEQKAAEKAVLRIRAAFDENVDSGDEEKIKMAMLKAGAKIKSVSSLYTGFMIETGALASKEDKAAAVEAAFGAEGADCTTEEGFNAIVAEVESNLAGATTASAGNVVRAYAKKAELECWKKPAGAGRQSGFRFQFYNALRANPQMTADEATAFGAEHGTENDVKAFSHYQAIRQMVNDVYANETGAEAA